jgi:hypothetical protein
MSRLPLELRTLLERLAELIPRVQALEMPACSQGLEI